MDLISREAVKAILDKGDIVIDEDVEKCESMHEVLVYLLEKVDDFIQKSIDVIPTIDAVPVVKGKWLANDSGTYFCSVCDSEAYWDTDYGQQLFGWCPYCGTDMREGGVK